MNVTLAITGIIGLVIGILVLSSLGNTIVGKTYTGPCVDGAAGYSNNTGCGLNNASATSKSMFSLLELLYPIIGVIFIVTAGFALKDRMGMD